MAFFHKGKLIKSATILGFGKSGRAVFEYLTKSYPPLPVSIRLQERRRDLPEGVRIFTGESLFSDFYEDLVFVSPSIRRDSRKLSGKLLSSDAELFFEISRHKIFAVTGSDGKSTTTSLAGLLLGDGARAIGNLGIPFTYALDYPDNMIIAAELSSFQLMDFAPRSKRAIITNITPNHLDWHLSMEEYVAAKENILKNAEEPVFFVDGERLLAIQKRYATFAVASASLSEYEIKKLRAEVFVYIKDGAIFINGEKLLEISDVLRKEDYNIKNFLSAIALSYGFFEKERLSEIAKSFSGLPHRFELIKSYKNTRIFNSSIDSSPQRTLASLSSYTAPYVLIMGGRTKMHNFEILLETIEKRACALVLTGENRNEIYSILKTISTPIYIEEDFNSAIDLALTLTENQCDLIFSPASVSFDSFENFEKRGEAFIAHIKKRTSDERFNI